MARVAIAAALSPREDSVYGQTDELSHPKPHQQRDELADFSTDRRVRILLTGAGDRRLAQLVQDHYSGLDELRRAMPAGSATRPGSARSSSRSGSR